MTTTLVTCALPYANGPVHLGHMVEHIQTDIYVRALKSLGEKVVFLCADDTHGAPIELNALKAGLSPEAFVAQWFDEHTSVFRDFQIERDHYGSTHSPENQHYANLIYARAKDAGSIGKKNIEQPYDEKAGRWLSDRFIRGTCPNPKCQAKDQYGDACEVCNATYSPREMKDARSDLSGEPLKWKPSSHAFFLLSRHAEFLKQTISNPSFMDQGSAAQLSQFFEKGLTDWDITRDGPYFGFPIPGETNQYFYVWLDAPIGYIAATEQWAKNRGQTALDYWNEESDTKIVHTIGKDIVYFHCLFWPAVLKEARLKRPSRVHIHGHLTVNGEKMSKSKGTFIKAREYLDVLDPNYLRFYFASLLGNGVEDIDLSLKEFRERTNAELVNNLGNLANRTLSLLAKEFQGQLAPAAPEVGRPLVEAALTKLEAIRTALVNFDSRTAVKTILEIGSHANQFLTVEEPWKKLKNADTRERAHRALSEAAEVVYLLSALLEPIVPQLAQKLTVQLNRPAMTLKQLTTASYPLLRRSEPVGEPAPLIARLEAEQVDKLVITKAVEPKKEVPKKPETQKANAPQPASEIEFTDFTKVVLKAGKVLGCEKVPNADKLLKLTVDLGEATSRTIVSGIAEAYAPEALMGRNVVVVTNLKPRALKGIESRGMILTAGKGGKDLVLLDPGDVAPGTEVK